MNAILVDTGVWYAIFDQRDRPQEREAVDRLADRIARFHIIVPWPVTYETLRSRFVKNRLALEGFEKQLKSPNIILVEDTPYRDEALALSLESSLRKNRPLSLVDCLIRILLDEPDMKIRYLATYNERDFSDICRNRSIEILK
ncbi:PIN domain-containing protein [Parvibaculum sedimenti]|uniref:PIN domain-containing protein n=1 Tax=Parvibaculum sedimenti TaxID=2608632 RepID=A0A6N6VHH3_9HYPH|nr:PIN domain-containing protein [Parvibaculum sedimenti]